MRIIKVDAIDSTNSFVRKFYEGHTDFEPLCVRAIHQINGRGQRGTQWDSKPGENLTFSILYPQNKLQISRHFLLSTTVAIAVLETLVDQNIPNLKLKWPNDILSAKSKIGGILIENVFKADEIAASVIGIGLNVNQSEFGKLPHAGSLKTVTGKEYDLDRLLEKLLQNIQAGLSQLVKTSSEKLLTAYESHLFRLNEVSVFKNLDGKVFNGIIRGVTSEGKLKVELENEQITLFDLKEIQMLY